MGYQIEGGQEETSAAGRRLYQPEKGPLAFVSEHAVVPLTEVEEAIVAWSACGPNGMAHWDIASSGGFHGMVGIAGRTAGAPGNSFATDLLVIKDDGAFIYNPGSERERMVEIQGEEDYHKILGGMRRYHAQDHGRTPRRRLGAAGARGAERLAVRALSVQHQPARNDLVHPDHPPRLAVLQRDAQHLRRLAHRPHRRQDR